MSAMVTSPTHRYRHEVAFTFRVFSPHEVLGILGSPIPVQPWRLRALGSSGFPVALRTRGRDSSDDPLLAFSSPSRYRPNNLARHPSTTSTSLGVSCPFNALGEGSPRPHRVSPMLAPWVLPRRLRVGSQLLGTVSLAGFLGLSATSSSPHRPAMFQTGSVRGVYPSGV